MNAKIWLVSLMAVCFSVQNILAADRVKGDGNLTTRKITIDDFNEIKFDGVIDFHYEQSETTPTVEITVDKNLHQYVNIDVKKRILSISFKGVKVDHYTKFVVKTNSKWLKSVRVAGNGNFMLNSSLTGDELFIKANANSLVQLKHPIKVGKLEMNVSGSANMVAESLKVESLECNVDGSGSITLKEGEANTGKYGISSSGDIHAFGMAIPQINCKITGNGLAELYPTENLKAQIIGNGNIRYKGPVAVQQTVVGKGTVEEAKNVTKK